MTQISELPTGTKIRWTDGSRTHEGVIVAWPDRPAMVEAVRVMETIVSEVPHVIGDRRHVEVMEP